MGRARSGRAGMENAFVLESAGERMKSSIALRVVTAASSLHSLNRAANIREEFDEVVSRSSLSVSFSLRRYLVNHGRTVGFVMCARM